jgi:hypothetical protein
MLVPCTRKGWATKVTMNTHTSTATEMSWRTSHAAFQRSGREMGWAATVGSTVGSTVEGSRI